MTELVKTEESLPKLGSGQMFDQIAGRYDFVNRVLSLGLDKRWRRRVIAELQLAPNATVLDVATGTGDLAIELAKAVLAGKVIGVDPSAEMLKVAAMKLAKKQLEQRVELVTGDCQALPQASCSVDAATISFGIRNVPDRALGLRELARVVRPGGRVAVLELGEPKKTLFGRVAAFHSHHMVPRLGALLSGRREYKYLQKSVAAFPSNEDFAQLMRDNGLDVQQVIPMTFGVCTLFIGTPKEMS
ncbi:MAG: bifunctional demethylmenaquinone methyltransferase/2-methoxy-6-polyprenyl-1,4-benzoquinol methylase UbiE [Kofleriaceae bacterium]